MHCLRSTRFLARLVLAWFALAVGAAVAAPLVQPQGWQLVCGAGSVKWLPSSGEDAAPLALTLDCALCAPAVVPPPPAWAFAVQYAGRPAPVADLPAVVPQAPVLRPPARGPPAYSLA